MKNKNRIISAIIAVLTIIAMIPSMIFAGGLALTANDAQSEAVDAMDAIEADSELSAFKKGETQSIADDGYIGIPVEISVYFSGENSDIVHGEVINATPVVVYVVNTNTERIGTDSDVNIIKSMLERGYIVAVFDYLNDERAVSPDLDWSIQKIRATLTKGTYFSNAGLPSGKYNNNMVVPAGYNVEFNLVFWEIDKYSKAGTLEFIVEIWNKDLRTVTNDNGELTKGKIIIPWVDNNGERKATQNGPDGTEPVWYADKNGTVIDQENGTYIMVKHTKALTITDCVNKDGSPIDLNLYMHITYPTNPGYDVPVMALSCSNEHLASGTQTQDRPQLTGFAFSGYAAVTFDHGYVPMARADHYDFFSDDASSYTIQHYNPTEITTAAMRFIRYLSASEHSKYSFDAEAVGVYGNSKGGWTTLLGAENPEESMYPIRVFPGHHGESRYEAGETETYTKDGATIDAGEQYQPWLSYGGNKIDGGADLIYASCGGGGNTITEGHAPMFISCNLGDPSYYYASAQMVNACKKSDVPALWLEVDQGHTLASAVDMRYGISSYTAFFDFAGYYLKGDAVKVLYISRAADKYIGLPSNAPITVKLTGPVALEEISKITITDAEGNAVSGEWSAQLGNTEWTFSSPTLKADEKYTLTVPAGIKGDNAKGMTSAYTYEFTTGFEAMSEVNTVTTDNGTYIYFDMPDASATGFNTNLYTLRLFVADNAVNKLDIYTVSSFNASSPDSSTVGALIGTAAVSGKGYYDVDVASLLDGKAAGERVVLLAKQRSEAGEVIIHSSPLTSDKGGCKVDSNYITEYAQAPDGTLALKITSMTTTSKENSATYYENNSEILRNEQILKSSALTDEDIGRVFRISFRIYDTDSRLVNATLSSAIDRDNEIADYNASSYNFYTKANDWTEVSFLHTVYEPLNVSGMKQRLTLSTSFLGDAPIEFYVSEIKSTEILTDIAVASAELLLGTTEQRENPFETEYGTIPEAYENADTFPFALFDANGEFIKAGNNLALDSDGLLAGLQDGSEPFTESNHVIVVRKNTEITSANGNFSFLHGNITIDLMGHTLTVSGELIRGEAKRSSTLNFTVKNGTMLQKEKSLIKIWAGSTSSYVPSANGPKIFNITLDGVTLGYAEGAATIPFVTAEGSTQKEVIGNVKFNGCTFDLKTNAPSGSFTLFKCANTANPESKVAVEIKGGSIKANSFDGITLASVNENGTLTFTANGDGSYTTLELPVGKEAPSQKFGELSFQPKSENGVTAIYEISKPISLETPYGTIPEEYSNIFLYPFVLFDADGNFVKAGDNLYTDNAGVLSVLQDGTSPFTLSNHFLVVRKNVEFTTQYANFSFLHGDITIDLMGNTITLSGDKGEFIYAEAKRSSTLNFTVKNGTMLQTAKSMIRIWAGSTSSYDPDTNGPKSFNFTFENMTLGYAEGAAAMPFVSSSGTTVKEVVSNVKFIDCTFDLITNAPSGAYNLFNPLNTTNEKSNIKIEVIGGEIRSSGLDGVTIAKTGDNGAFEFKPDASGNYATLTLPASKSAPAGQGSLYFVLKSNDDKTAVYTLTEKSPLATEYGAISEAYSDVMKYPFALFCEGVCVGCYSDWATALTNAKNEIGGASSVGNTATVLLRRSYYATESDTYSNLSQVGGTLVLDLGGNTFYVGKNDMFYAEGKLTSGAAHPTSVKVMNGTVLNNGEGAVVVMRSSNKLTQEHDKSFSFIFEGVTFGITENNSCPTPIIKSYTSSGYACAFDFSFNSCIFDYTSTAPTGSITVFQLERAGGDTSNAEVTVNGGSFILNSFDAISLYECGTNDSFAFSRLDGGAYTSLVLPKTAAAPTAEYDGYKFIEASSDEATVTYTLAPKASEGINFTPKASVTLDSNLIFNIYIPEREGLGAVTLNGNHIVLGEAKDGYYLVSVELPSNEAAREIVLAVNLEVNGTALKGSFTFSTVKYAEKLLAAEGISEAEKALAKDMLNYIDSAYKHFGGEGILDETYASGFDIAIAAAKKTVPGLSGATFVLDAKPAVQFYFAQGFSYGDFTFKVGGRVLTEKDISKQGADFVEFSLYAYEMTEDFTYTVGTESGSYNLASYYAYASGTGDNDYKGEDKATLTDLVAKFYNYCASAKAYKAYIVANQ